MPEFPVYTRSGEVTICIELLAGDIHFTEEQTGRLSEFHRFVFNNVLRLEKDPMVFSPSLAELGYLIIPLLKGKRKLQSNLN